MDKMNLLEPQDWTFPVPIAYGPGRLKEIAAMCSEAGMSKPLIITDRGSRDLPFIADVGQYLQADGMSSNVYANISPNPRDDEIAAGCEAYRQGAHDGIIAIGGGSGMDGGKAICLVAASDIDLCAFEF
jgi:alcohol dehydrogenase class IV